MEVNDFYPSRQSRRIKLSRNAKSGRASENIRGKQLKKNITFKGGLVFRADRQPTDTLPIEPLQPAPPIVTIPLLQHRGGIPAQPVVKPGDCVSMGQMIGKAADGSSAAVHASVSGTVIRVSRYPFIEGRDIFAVSIENNGDDEFASPIPYDKTWQDSSPEELVTKISLSGIIDFNGTAVPAHIKLSAAIGSPSGSLLLNAMATEPFATADCRLLVEQTEKALTGGLICKKITGAERLSIVINDKNTAIEQPLIALLNDERFKNIALIKLKPTYPQHHEKLLSRCAAASGAGSNPDHSTVLDAATAVHIRDAVMESVPWYQRVVTVAGPTAGSPKNLLVRIGTPAASLLDAAKVDLEKTVKIISGVPLSGSALSALDAPVTKSTNALIALDISFPGSRGFSCINCGRCVSVCPMHLAPARLARLAQKSDFAEALDWRIHDCIDCGCCAYVCPSSINLVHLIQYGKRRVTSSMQSKVPV
jgi:Na+-translocating ferredoxin:NAD+ oxidoreductase subunit C